MAKIKQYQGLLFVLKTNYDNDRDLDAIEKCLRFVWNRFRWINHSRLVAGIPILRYEQMAFYLVLWKKSDEMAWLKFAPSQALQQTLMDLDRAYMDAFDKSQPDKKLPRYRSRDDSMGIRFPQGFKIDNRRVFFPKIGWIGFFKSRNIFGKLKNITINKEGGKRYMSILVEEELDSKPVHPSTKLAGGDFGVKKHLTMSDGTEYKAPDKSKKEKKAKRARKDLARKEKGSNNWNKQVKVVQKEDYKVACARKDGIHKITHDVGKKYAIVVIEDLNAKAMSKSAKGTFDNPGTNVAAKRGLNRSLLDRAPRELRRQLEYKMEWRGGQLVLVNPRYTSQMCSMCGFTCKENRKTQASFRCLKCNYSANADFNAARNILNRGLEKLAAAGQAVTVCGENP